MSWIVRAFPLWVCLGAVVAFVWPSAYAWVTPALISAGLGLIMLAMGVGLEAADFRRVAQQPMMVMLGVLLQYTVMPGLGYLSADLYDLPLPLATGVILVACCPGGTASNVVTYLARADVALSVSLTAVSTLLAAVVTPMLTALLLDSRVEVDAVGLFLSTLKVVIVPVLAGFVLRKYLPRVGNLLVPVSPVLAIASIVLIVGSILASSRDELAAAASSLLAALVTLHAGGFALGYLFSRFNPFGRASIPQARTISIEVGMQNSALGVVLARAHFASPLVALPCALSSVMHCVIGSALAGIWGRSNALHR